MPIRFPITITEAARRLNVPINTAGILVRAFSIPTCRLPLNGSAKGLDRDAYRLLKARSEAFVRDCRRERVRGRETAIVSS